MGITPLAFCKTIMALRCLMIPIIVGLFLLHPPCGTVRFAAAEPAVGPLSEERVEQAIRDLGFEPGRSMFANGSPYPGVGSLVIGGGKGAGSSPRPGEEAYGVSVFFSGSAMQLQASIKDFVAKGPPIEGIPGRGISHDEFRFFGAPTNADLGTREWARAEVRGWSSNTVAQGNAEHWYPIGTARVMFLRDNLLCEVRYQKAGPLSGIRDAPEFDPSTLERIKAEGLKLGEEAKTSAMALAKKLAERLRSDPVAPAPAPDVPELPLLIPTASLEGTLKADLTAKKQEVLRHVQAAKVTAGSTWLAGKGSATGFDALGFLVNWYDANRGVLDAERQARKAAEEFFPLLALCYDRMTDAERATVEKGLSDRAFALRGMRGAQRVTIRAMVVRSAADLDAYYEAVSRATWAALELESLVRMWGAMNQARIVYHSRFDVYDLSEPGPNPARLKATQAAQRHHFEALVDMGIAALLASEIQLEANLEAQKDRLFTLREGLGEVKGSQEPGAQALAEIFSLGFTVFDITAGLAADIIKGEERTSARKGFYDALGIEFTTRAEKLDQKATEHWDRTQRKVVFLRQFKPQPPGKISVLAERAARGAALANLELLGTQLNDDQRERVRFLEDDRIFVEATDGGLLRMLATALVDLPSRCRMELRIAREQTRLLRRDMEAALRREKGLDPETGELTWATILSPTAWGNVLSKLAIDWLGPAKDLTRRATEIALKAQQMAAMEKLENALLLDRVGFRFELLPDEAWAEHVRLWASSAPYAAFVLKTEYEWQALTLHGWRRDLRPDLDLFPEASLRKAYHEEMVEHFGEVVARHEQQRITRLKLQDCLVAWDLPGALALADSVVMRDRLSPEDDAEAQAYAGVAKLLREELAYDRFKSKAITTLQNVGDIGFYGWAFKGFSLVRDASRTWSGFARYAWEVVNPFAHHTTVNAQGIVQRQPRAARAVFTQAATEIFVGMGVPATGEKYEALLNQILNVAVDIAAERVGEGAERLAKRFQDLQIGDRLQAAVVAEKARYAQLDSQQYLVDLLNRAWLRTFAQMGAFHRALVNTKHLDIRASLARQMAETKRLSVTWAAAAELSQRARTLRASLRDALQDPKGLRARLVGVHQALAAATLPPTRAYYEWVLQARSGDLFNSEKGLDIERLRVDFKAMRGWIRPEDRPALDQLEGRIDRVRHERFLKAMGDFLSAHGGKIKGVILNGAQPGDPEYRNLFSDLDFTVLVPQGADPTGVQHGLDVAFAKHDMALNAKGSVRSADIEAMIQDFLPGEVRPIRTEADLKLWLEKLVKDPARYLSAGGAEWVGLYNYLNGRTLRLEGGRAVIDSNPNPDLLPPPALHPILAHGLVLDAAQSNKVLSARSIADTATLAEMTAVRAKSVLRVVDALIWALYPDRLRARTREAARQFGYHGLIVADARILVERGFLSQAEFNSIQILVDLKAGKTAVQALNLDPARLNAGRPRLEALWDDMNVLMRRTYRDTRTIYLDFLKQFAKTPSGLGPDELFTLAFRNSNARRKVPPDTLWFLAATRTGPPEAGLEEQIKREERDIIAAGLGWEPTPPAVAPPTGRAEPEILPPHQRSDEPSPNGDPHATPTALHAVQAPAPVSEPPFRIEEIFEPLDPATVEFPGNSQGYLHGRRVAIERDDPDPLFGTDAIENEVAAYQLGRRLGANIPWADVVTHSQGPRAGVRAAVMRWIESLDPLGDLLGAVLEIPHAHVSPGFDLKRLEPFKTPQARERLRTQYLSDLLVSMILGDFDRKSNNYVLTPDVQLAGIDHAEAQPLELDIGRIRASQVAQRMQARLTNERASKLTTAFGITHEHVASAWSVLKAKLTRADGTLDPNTLQQIAQLYGDRAKQVLQTLNLRVHVLEAVLAEHFKARYKVRPMDYKAWESDHDRNVKYFSPSELQQKRLVIIDGKLYDVARRPIDTVVRDAAGRPKVATDAQGKPLEQNGQPVYEHRTLLYVMDASGEFYITLEEPGLKHSSFLRGAAVAAAGVLQVVDGKLRLINNYSGHYLPEKSYLEQATTQLRQLGLAVAPEMVDAGGGEAW